MAHFELQPAESELQQLAEQCWLRTGDKERLLEQAAFEAGSAIKNGDFSLTNLELIVRWKSEELVHYVIGNSEEQIRRALRIAASPQASTEEAIDALTDLRGVDIPVASAILTAIFPERYTVLDFRALEALGHARHDARFYKEYVAFCRRLAERGGIEPQRGLPAPTSLRTLDRALAEWSRSHVSEGVAA